MPEQPDRTDCKHFNPHRRTCDWINDQLLPFWMELETPDVDQDDCDGCPAYLAPLTSHQGKKAP